MDELHSTQRTLLSEGMWEIARHLDDGIAHAGRLQNGPKQAPKE
jgi:hypothetical protein